MVADRVPLITALRSGSPGEANPGRERVLDAALTQFEEIGIRRSTIEDIARRAGIDRVTVYRRVGGKDDVVQAVLVREAQRLIAHVTAACAALPTFEQRVAVAFATAVQQSRGNPLYSRMVTLEPDTVLPRITTGARSLLAIGVSAVVGLIRQAQRDGILGDVDAPQTVAEVVVRVIHSFVLSPEGVLPLGTDAQLERFAIDHLAPIVTRRVAVDAGSDDYPPGEASPVR